MAFGCTLTVEAGKIPSSQSGFIWFFTEQNFTDANNEEAIDGTANSILNGGGNLRCYTDDTKATQLPIQVVKFVTGITPSIEVWGISSALAVGETVFVEADSTAVAQPAVTDTYGRNAVWAFYDGVWHLGESTGDFIDSTGNGWDITPTTETGVNRVATGQTGDCVDLDGQNITATQLQIATGSDATWNDAHSQTTLQAWVARDSDETAPAVIIETGGTASGEALYYRNGPNTLHYGTSQSSSSLELDSTTTMPEFSGFFMIHGTYNSGAQSLYINGALEGSGTNGSQITAANSESSLGCEGLSITAAVGSGAPWSGRLNEVRRARGSRGADYITAEHNNQSDSGAFWSTSAWVDSGGSGISIVGDTALFDFNALAGTVDLTGEILVTGSTASFDYAVISGSVDLTGQLLITGGTANFDYAALPGSVDLTGEIIVTGSTADFDYAGENGIVELGAVINVVGQTATFDFNGVNSEVSLAGEIVIIGDTATFNYQALSGLVVIGEGQKIGKVTAGFAESTIGVQYKQNTITVNFGE